MEKSLGRGFCAICKLQHADLLPLDPHPSHALEDTTNALQQLSTPGGKPPEKESVLKQLEQLQQKKSNYKTISTTPNREESL